MVKICQRGLLKLNFELYKKHIYQFLTKILQFFGQFPNPWVLRVSGTGCHISKCEKARIIAPYCTLQKLYWHLLGCKDISFLVSVRHFQNQITFIITMLSGWTIQIIPWKQHLCYIDNLPATVHCKKSWRSSSTPASGDAGPKHTGVEQSFRHPCIKFYYKYRTFSTFFTSDRN